MSKHFAFAARFVPVTFFDEDPITITFTISDEMDRKVDNTWEKYRSETNTKRKRALLEELIGVENTEKLLSRVDSPDGYMIDQLYMYARQSYIEGKQTLLASAMGGVTTK